MSILRSSAEIFGLAKAIEKGGQAYYQAISSSTASPELKVDAMEWGQTSAYIMATSDSRFFVGEDKALSLARIVKEPLQAIDIAIGFEKDTLLFFYELLLSERRRRFAEAG